MSAPPPRNPMARRVVPGGRLCRIEEIVDRGSLAFVVRAGSREIEFFVVGAPDIQGGVRAWMNYCPHLHQPLNWRHESCLTRDGERILCIVHAASFSRDRGEMITGPESQNRQLIAVPLALEGQDILLATEEVLCALPDPWIRKDASTGRNIGTGKSETRPE